MDFDLNADFNIFDDLLKKRSELSAARLKKDLEKYYIPFAKKLIDLRKAKSNAVGLLVGVCAIQGAGKTTQGEILEILLSHFGFSSVSRSIDDHYITHKELIELRKKDPRYIRRGVTHDIGLAIKDLKDLQTMTDQKPIIVSGYDKGAHHGDGDRFRWINPELNTLIKTKIVEEKFMIDGKLQKVRALQIVKATNAGAPIELPENMGSDVPIIDQFFPQELLDFLNVQEDREINIADRDDETIQFATNVVMTSPKKNLPNGWRVIIKKPDFIFYDGWMLGVRRVEDESVFDAKLPALETPEDKKFARDINKKLDTYLPLWQMIEFLNVLYVTNYKDSLKWRDQAEEVLRKKGEGMSKKEIVEFVHYFWRSVHPAIHIKNLAHDETHTNQVVIINDDHSIGDILTPDQVQ